MTDGLNEGKGVYSENDIVFLDHLCKHFSARFPPGSPTLWGSPKVLKAEVQREADHYGFTVAHVGSSLRCTRHAEPPNCQKRRAAADVPEHKRRKTVSFRCNCPFIMRFAQEKVNGARTGAVRITLNSCYRHDNGCLPCPQQAMSDAVHSGTLCKDWLTAERLETIIEIFLPILTPECCVNS